MLNYSLLNSESTSGTVYVLLHGFLEDSSMWDSILHVFTQKKVLLIDLPGHGKSSGYDQKEYSMHFMAHEVQKVLEKEEILKPVIIGHSMGGYVGLELMKIVDLKKMVLFNSNFWKDSEVRRSNRNRVIEIVDKNKSVFLLEAIRNLFYLQNDELDLVVKDLIEKASLMSADEIIKTTIGLRDRLDNHQIIDEQFEKVEIIQADKDPIISTEEMNQNLEQLNKKPELHTIVNSGHMSIWENPEATNRILSKILIN